ncbi:MAG: hypothetical protein Q9174_005657 [Haloplaca sp. 1 TL-2023]
MPRTTQAERRGGGSSHKRVHSAPRNEYPGPTKVPKTQVQHDFLPSDSLEDANARIKDLEQQVCDLHEFINAHGLTRPPDFIRKHTDQQANAAQTLATQIRNAAGKVCGRLSGQALSARRTGVTCDDISSAVMPFLVEAEDISNVPGGVAPAFDLVMDLAYYTHSGLADGDSAASGYGDRPSDEVVDGLIIALATRRKQLEPSWSHVEVLEKLRKQNEKVAGFGIEEFCARSIEYLDGWPKPLAQT